MEKARNKTVYVEGTLLKLLLPAETQGKAFKEGIMQQCKPVQFSITELKCQCGQYNESIGHPWITLSFQ